jgi:hypothetical protein
MMKGAGRVAVVILLLAACRAVRGDAPRPVPPLADVETTLFLIGDAGNPRPQDPVLTALAREMGRDPVRAVAVFLGDNIYPDGLPPRGARDRREMERRLDAQIEPARAHRARAIFVPGNHDWNGYRPGGWEAVKRQGAFIAERGAGLAALLPENGCPGPAVRDFEKRLRLIALDTQWWVHGAEKPTHPTSTCPEDSEGEVLAALEAAIGSAADRRVVVVAHHPLATGGLHGGYFGWTDHLFPLRAKKSWLWIPLPGIGSLYPAARRRGVSDQDMGGAGNRRMREGLEEVFSRQKPMVYAAGHDHNLQVIKGRNVKVAVVSGAGYFGHLSRAAWTKDTLFAREASGFVRVDVGKGGDARLSVVTVDAASRAAEVFALELE